MNPDDVLLREGFRIEAVAADLTFPSGTVTDDANRLHVLEATYSYGEVIATPRLIRLEPGGYFVVLAEGERSRGPWTGVSYHRGNFLCFRRK